MCAVCSAFNGEKIYIKFPCPALVKLQQYWIISGKYSYNYQFYKTVKLIFTQEDHWNGPARYVATGIRENNLLKWLISYRCLELGYNKRVLIINFYINVFINECQNQLITHFCIDDKLLNALLDYQIMLANSQDYFQWTVHKLSKVSYNQIYKYHNAKQILGFKSNI